MNLELKISWQVQYFVGLEVQILLQVQYFGSADFMAGAVFCGP